MSYTSCCVYTQPKMHDTDINVRLTHTDKLLQKNKLSQPMIKFISIDENKYILKATE